MGIGTLFTFNMLNPINAQNLNPNVSTEEEVSSTINDEQMELAGNFRHDRRINSRHQRRNQTIIVVPGVGNTSFYNGNMRRNNTYWNNNNRNINQVFPPHNRRDIYQGNIRRNPSNFINQRDRQFRRSERQCIHRVFQSAWGEIHCRSNNPSFEWRTIYLD